MELRAAVQGLAALAQESRLTIVRLLVRAGPPGVPAGEIARALSIPANTLSAHLGVLAQAGLVDGSREGRTIRYAVRFEALGALVAFLVADCCQGHPLVCDAALGTTRPVCSPRFPDGACS